MHLAEMNYFTNLETYVLGDANPGSINKNLGFEWGHVGSYAF